MKKLLFITIILCGCSRPFDVDMKEYKAAAERWCAPCGGLSAAFINQYGNEIACKDGSHLSQHFGTPPQVLALGTCK